MFDWTLETRKFEGDWQWRASKDGSMIVGQAPTKRKARAKARERVRQSEGLETKWKKTGF